MKRLLAAGLFPVLFPALAACATSVTSVSQAPDCPVVGAVDARSDYPGMYPFLGPVVAEQRAKNLAMLKAEEMGATHVKWDSTETRSLAAWVYGTAYNCSNKDKDGMAVERPQDKAVRLAVLKRAGEGSALDQYLYGRDYAAGPVERKNWFCLAAHNGNAAALYGLARLYDKELPPEQRDQVKAYKYFLLGRRDMPASADGLAPGLSTLPDRMTDAEIAAAKSAAENWKPDPKACGN